MNERKLILIKHSKPLVDPRLPSHQWRLSDEGRQRCEPLVQAVRAHQPRIVISSEEPKASETARILSAGLGVPFQTAAGLGEHDRSNVPHMESREFISRVAHFFKNPQMLVLGRETAQAACDRLAAALNDLLQGNADGNIAVVTHGTVLALLVAEKTGEDGFLLWRRMGLPSMIVFGLPRWDEVERTERFAIPSAAGGAPPETGKGG